MKIEDCGSNQRSLVGSHFSVSDLSMFDQGAAMKLLWQRLCTSLYLSVETWKSLESWCWQHVNTARTCKLCNVLKKRSSIIFLLCCLKEFQILLRYLWKGVLLIKEGFFSPSKYALRQSSSYFFLLRLCFLQQVH